MPYPDRLCTQKITPCHEKELTLQKQFEFFKKSGVQIADIFYEKTTNFV